MPRCSAGMGAIDLSDNSRKRFKSFWNTFHWISRLDFQMRDQTKKYGKTKTNKTQRKQKKQNKTKKAKQQSKNKIKKKNYQKPQGYTKVAFLHTSIHCTIIIQNKATPAGHLTD